MTATIQKAAPKTNVRSPLLMLGARYDIAPDKLIEVLRGTVIKPDKNGRAATNEELAAFCIVAAQYDLNPFTREIYAFAAQGKGIVAIVPIDGWCKIVNRHKNANGKLDFDGCEFNELEAADGKPVSCTCIMHIKGREHPVSATERYVECKRDTGPWGQHPFRMLRHKAYMQAARYAFGLGGIHDDDEGRDIEKFGSIEGEVRDPVTMPVPKTLLPAPEPASATTTAAPTANEEVEITIVKCGQKPGGTKAKPNLRTWIQDEKGNFMSTFDTTLGAFAMTLKCKEALVLRKVGEKGMDLLAILEPQPEGADPAAENQAPPEQTASQAPIDPELY